jgi:hypothetical protein
MNEQAQAAAAQLRAAVDSLLHLQLGLLHRDEVTELFRAVEAERCRLEAVDHVVIAELEQRQIAGEYGRTGTVDLLVDQIRIAPAEAKARVRAAEDLGPRHDQGGQPLAPLFSHVAAAQRDGVLGAGAARVIGRCLDDLPTHLDGAQVERAEALLVELAAHLHPGLLGKAAQRLLAHVDPDGIAPREQDSQRRRGFTLHEHADGSGTPTGRLSPAAMAVWRPILDALSAPHTEPGPDGQPVERDDRTPAQRRHDGFLEAGMRLLRSSTLPDCGGVPVTVLARLDATQLRDRLGLATTGTGGLLPVPQLLELASEAEIIPVVCDDTGGILAYGHTRRLASTAQRKALALRDGGCCFPGCTRPPSWCEARHVIPWLDGGRTDLDNLCLLCSWHHRQFEHRGWAVQITDGQPEWTPPAWFDPQRSPIRNTAHHPPDIDFDVDLAG